MSTNEPYRVHNSCETCEYPEEMHLRPPHGKHPAGTHEFRSRIPTQGRMPAMLDLILESTEKLDRTLHWNTAKRPLEVWIVLDPDAYAQVSREVLAAPHPMLIDRPDVAVDGELRLHLATGLTVVMVVKFPTDR